MLRRRDNLCPRCTERARWGTQAYCQPCTLAYQRARKPWMDPVARVRNSLRVRAYRARKKLLASFPRTGTCLLCGHACRRRIILRDNSVQFIHARCLGG